MLPHFDIEVSVDEINPDLLRVIWCDEVTGDGIGNNRVYSDVTGADWQDVEKVINAEETPIDAADEKLDRGRAERAGSVGRVGRRLPPSDQHYNCLVAVPQSAVFPVLDS